MCDLKYTNTQKQRVEWWVPGVRDGECREMSVKGFHQSVSYWSKFQLCKTNTFGNLM